MSNYLYGSSNVYRNFKRACEAGRFSGRDLQLVSCTKKTVLDAHLTALTSASLVVTSVLENFITDVCIGVADDEVQLFAHQQITAHVETLSDLTSRFPDVAIIIVPPFFRSTPPWFGSYLPDFLGFLTSEVARISSRRMTICAPFIVYPSLLEADGVHLTPSGGDLLMMHLETALNSLILDPASTSDAEMEDHSASASSQLSQILTAVTRNTAQLDTISSLGEAITGLTQSTSTFEAFVRRRFKKDDFIFARMKEESDADVNRSREDRVVISGLAASTLNTHAEKKRHFIGVVNRLVEIAFSTSESMPKVVDVYVNLRKDRGLPLIEARFDTASGAQAFRREGVRLAKAEHAEFASLFLSNSVTQATRVRIEVLKALATRLSTATETAFVQGFVSRPVLHYHPVEGAPSTADGVGRSYNYVDAIAKFGSKLSHPDLVKSYTRAGKTFQGSMSQYFVVLSDELVSLSGTGSNREPLGRRGAVGGRAGPSRTRGGRGRGPHRSLLTDLDRGVKRQSTSHEEEPANKQESTLSVTE